MLSNKNLSDEYYIGLMSGTSIDGVDGVLVKISYTLFNDTEIYPALKKTSPDVKQFEILAQSSLAFSSDIRQAILGLQSPKNNEIHQANLIANLMVKDYYAPCVLDLLKQAKSKGVAKENIKAVAVHGQTIRHQPKMHDGLGYTLQLNQPALLAALLDLPVVTDFRVADLYRGGQAAPLVPAFHAQLHDLIQQNNKTHELSIFCNIGGMSNISLISDAKINYNSNSKSMIGFDCGPGNVLLDAWIEHDQNKSYDHNGEWAKTGEIQANLLNAFLEAPYFKQAFPKSTGREVFNLSFILNQLIQPAFKDLAPKDVQATLVELTAISIRDSIHSAIQEVLPTYSTPIYICGGGAYNPFLLERLAFHLPQPQYHIQTSLQIPQISIPPQEMEALAFAWLGFMRIHEAKINLTSITGSAKPAILGAIYL